MESIEHIVSQEINDKICEINSKYIVTEFDDTISKQKEREIAETVNCIKEKYAPIKRSALSKSALSFPSTHGASAVSSIFSSYDDSFRIYVWREDGEVWIEIEPLTETPFVCSASFSIIQNNIQFDTVRFETISGDSQCGDVLIKSIYKLSQWSYLKNQANLDGTFSLYFDGGDNNYSIDIQENALLNTDDDGDGYTENQGDCNDSNDSIYPGADEICGDGIDQDCSGSDLTCPNAPTSWYKDNDNDGYGDPASSIESDTLPSGYVANKTDCNDNDASTHPGATEICGDGIDQDCNGSDLVCPDDTETPAENDTETPAASDDGGGGCFIESLIQY